MMHKNFILKGLRDPIAEEIDTILSDHAVENYREAVLDPEDNRLTVRNRLIAAARRRGFGIKFRRTSSSLLRFQVVAQNGEAQAVPAVPESVIEPAPVPKKRGGRARKTA
jgi:hypothetical protein